MRHFGLMITKDEAPILADVMAHNTEHIKEIYVLDGGSDNAESVLRKFPEVKHYVHARELESRFGAVKRVDGIRGYVFNEILRVAQPGDWVTLMHGDEIFHHDPNETITMATIMHANLVEWCSAHFFPHVDDWSHWDHLRDRPISQRFRHFAHYGNRCGCEHRQFRIMPGMAYDLNRDSKVVPEYATDLICFPAHPMLKHFAGWNRSQQQKDFFAPVYPGYPAVGFFNGDFGSLEQSYMSLRQKLERAVLQQGMKLSDLIRVMVELPRPVAPVREPESVLV